MNIKLKRDGIITAKPILTLPISIMTDISGKKSAMPPTFGIEWLIACSIPSISDMIVCERSEMSCLEKYDRGSFDKYSAVLILKSALS